MASRARKDSGIFEKRAPGNNERYFIQSMFLVYTKRITFAPPGKSYLIGFCSQPRPQGAFPWFWPHSTSRLVPPLLQVVLFTHKNDCGGSILWLNEAVPCRSRKWSVTYRIGIGRYFGVVRTPIRPFAEGNKLVPKYIKYQQVYSDKPMSGAGSPSCRPGSVQ